MVHRIQVQRKDLLSCFKLGNHSWLMPCDEIGLWRSTLCFKKALDTFTRKCSATKWTTSESSRAPCAPVDTHFWALSDSIVRGLTIPDYQGRTHTPRHQRSRRAYVWLDAVIAVEALRDFIRCFCFQNSIRYLLDTLIQKSVFLDNKNKHFPGWPDRCFCQKNHCLHSLHCSCPAWQTHLDVERAICNDLDLQAIGGRLP